MKYSRQKPRSSAPTSSPPQRRTGLPMAGRSRLSTSWRRSTSCLASSPLSSSSPSLYHQQFFHHRHHQVTCPVLLYWGAGDWLAQPRGVARIADQLPNLVDSVRVRPWFRFPRMFFYVLGITVSVLIVFFNLCYRSLTVSGTILTSSGVEMWEPCSTTRC